MAKLYGLMVIQNDDSTTSQGRISIYDSYEEMVNDTRPPKYGIVNNVVYHRDDTGNWLVGFPQVNNYGEYTAWEVYANDNEIPVGYCEELDGNVSRAIPAGMTEKFQVRTWYSNQSDIKTIIDWGDGTISCLNTDGEFSSNGRVTISHTYSKAGKYIVKVVGNDFFGIVHAYQHYNLMCRALEDDLPIAKSHINFASFCRWSVRMLKLEVTQFPVHVGSLNMFVSENPNITKITGMGYWCDANTGSMYHVCWGDSALVTTDIYLPRKIYTASDIIGAFHDCKNLTMDIGDFVEENTVSNWVGHINMGSVFGNCPKLTGTVPKFWENTNVQYDFYYTDTKDIYPFNGCSAEILAQVPVSWGGTMEPVVSEPSDEPTDDTTNGDSSSSGSETEDLNCYMIETDVPLLTGHYVPYESWVVNGQPVYYNETTTDSVTAGSIVAFAIKEVNYWKIAAYSLSDDFLNAYEEYFTHSMGSDPRVSSNNPEKLEDCVFENAGGNTTYWYDGMTTTITKCVSH